MNDNSNSDFHPIENSKSDLSVDFSLKKRHVIVLLLAYSAILGIMLCFLPENDKQLDFILGIPILILGNMWCYIDAAERNRRIGQFVRILLAVIYIFGLAIYLFKSRGIRAFKSFLLLFLLVLAMYSCSYLTSYTTLSIGERLGYWEVGY